MITNFNKIRESAENIEFETKMQGYNLILVYNKKIDKILMCVRSKHPFKGTCNLVGGKIESGEAGIDAAYRELFEETGISKEHISLRHIIDFTYYIEQCYLEVYVGKLEQNVALVEEKNKLLWVDADENFFDMRKYAGKGNIGHIIEQVKIYKKELFDKTDVENILKSKNK